MTIIPKKRISFLKFFNEEYISVSYYCEYKHDKIMEYLIKMSFSNSFISGSSMVYAYQELKTHFLDSQLFREMVLEAEEKLHEQFIDIMSKTFGRVKEEHFDETLQLIIINMVHSL